MAFNIAFFAGRNPRFLGLRYHCFSLLLTPKGKEAINNYNTTAAAAVPSRANKLSRNYCRNRRRSHLHKRKSPGLETRCMRWGSRQVRSWESWEEGKWIAVVENPQVAMSVIVVRCRPASDSSVTPRPHLGRISHLDRISLTKIGLKCEMRSRRDWWIRGGMVISREDFAGQFSQKMIFS